MNRTRHATLTSYLRRTHIAPMLRVYRFGLRVSSFESKKDSGGLNTKRETRNLVPYLYRALDFALGDFATQGLALVVELFAARQTQLDFGAAVFEINL